jgi:CBS domain-containing protein
MTLDRSSVGALVLRTSEGAVAGVFSERDLVKALARHGSDALLEQVSTFVSHDVPLARPEDTVLGAMQLMTVRRVRHLPVVTGDVLEGVVSLGDLVKWRIAEADAEVDAIRSYIQH